MELKDITPVIVALIGLISAVMSVIVAPLVKAKLEQTKEEIGAVKFDKIYSVVVAACKAAEQLAKNGAIDKEERKKKVLEWLSKYGFTVDIDMIEILIEAAVNDIPSAKAKSKVEKVKSN